MKKPEKETVITTVLLILFVLPFIGTIFYVLFVPKTDEPTMQRDHSLDVIPRPPK